MAKTVIFDVLYLRNFNHSVTVTQFDKLIFYGEMLRIVRYCYGMMSACLSVCNVEVPWSHRLEILENNFMAD